MLSCVNSYHMNVRGRGFRVKYCTILRVDIESSISTQMSELFNDVANAFKMRRIPTGKVTQRRRCEVKKSFEGKPKCHTSGTEGPEV